MATNGWWASADLVAMGFTIAWFLLTVYRLCVVAYSAVVREPIFLFSGVFCRISRDTDDKRTVVCMLCCSMVRCEESVLFFEPQKKRRRHHGVDGRRVAPSVNDGNDLFFGLVTAEQRYIGWNGFCGHRGVTMTRSGRAV